MARPFRNPFTMPSSPSRRPRARRTAPRLQHAVKEELVRREILAQEAKKKGLDKKANIRSQIELAKQAVLIRAFLTDYVQAHPISDAQLKAEYELIKNNLGSTEYKSRHVLVEKEDDAKAIIAKLDKGEKFSGAGQAVQGSRLEGQGRRTRLELPERLRQAVCAKHWAS